MEKIALLPDGVTSEMIANWKKQYGDDKIKLAHLNDGKNDKALSVIVRVPDRQVYNQFDKWVGSDPGKARDILVKNCLLTESEKVQAVDELYFSASSAIVELLPLHKAIVEDL